MGGPQLNLSARGTTLRFVPKPAPARAIIDDILDPQITARLEAIVADVFAARKLPGRWVVALARAEERGRWSVRIRSPFGRHLFSFPASAHALAVAFAEQLSRALDRLVP
jgi:hypothetical protein